MEEWLVFVGNRGSGKSVVLNSLIGPAKIKSGFCIITKLTSDYHLAHYEIINYENLAGHFDMKKQAALKINETLKKNEKSKLIFVVTVEDDHVTQVDLDTIKSVLDSIEDKSFPYNIVVNKANELHKAQKSDKASHKKIQDQLKCIQREISLIYYYPKESGVDEANPEFISASKTMLATNILLQEGKSAVTEDGEFLSKKEVLKENSDRQLKHKENLPEYVIFVGNPGVGKSTLLNSLIQNIKFESGISTCGGKTKTTTYVRHNDIHYVDTPGLNDIQSRKNAAEQIIKALKYNGMYKLVFVITLESGRILPEDLATIKFVMQLIDDKSFPFAIVVNKASEQFLKKIKDKKKKKEFISKLTYEDYIPQLYCYPKRSVLNETENALDEKNHEFSEFLRTLPSKQLLPDNVKTIIKDDYDELRKNYEKDKQELTARHKSKQEELERQRQANSSIGSRQRESTQ